MDNETTQLTTRDIEELVRHINNVFWQWRIFAGTDRAELGDATSWRNLTIKALHGVVKPSRRPYALLVLVDIFDNTLSELEVAYWMLEEAAKARGARELARENMNLMHEAQALRARVATLEGIPDGPAHQVSLGSSRMMAWSVMVIPVPGNTRVT